MAHEILGVAGGFVAGLSLGAAYCAMLWFAVRRLCLAPQSALWLIVTALPRLALPMAGFYWVMDGRWESLVACLAGFVLLRIIVQQRLRSRGSTAAAAF